jgi:hypothetical protein
LGIPQSGAIECAAAGVTRPVRGHTETGQFLVADKPHAMNGALIHDYLANFQLVSPIKFATNYYLHYPALTGVLYPPVFKNYQSTHPAHPDIEFDVPLLRGQISDKY